MSPALLVRSPLKKRGHAASATAEAENTGERVLNLDALNAGSVYEPGACPGCGARFQLHTQGAAGFVGALARSGRAGTLASPRPKPNLNPRPTSQSAAAAVEAAAAPLALADVRRAAADPAVLCDRCFDLRHHSREHGRVFPANPPQYFESVRTKLAGPVVLLLDALDATATLVPDLGRIVGNDRRIVVVVNKSDALPESARRPFVREWLLQQVQRSGGATGPAWRPESIFFCSARTGDGIVEAMRAVAALRRSPDDHVILIGKSNVGKSHFVSALWRLAGDSERAKMLVSHCPGTTAGLLRLPLAPFSALLSGSDTPVSPRARLYDTPGLEVTGSFANLLTLKELQQLESCKALQPVSFCLPPDQTLFLGGLARLDVLDAPTTLTTFIASTVPVHRTATHLADGVYERHFAERHGKLRPPLGGAARRKTWPVEQSVQDFTFAATRSAFASGDICFPGLGWVSVCAASPLKRSRVRVHVPDGVKVSTRDAMFPTAHHVSRKPKLGLQRRVIHQQPRGPKILADKEQNVQR